MIVPFVTVFSTSPVAISRSAIRWMACRVYELTYNSNAVEGNTLNLREMELVLNWGAHDRQEDDPGTFRGREPRGGHHDRHGQGQARRPAIERVLAA